MKYIFSFLIALLLISGTNLRAQLECGMDLPVSLKQDNNLQKSIICDLDPLSSDITTKVISLTFHVFRKDDGTGHFAESGWNEIDYHLVNTANIRLGNLPVPNPSSPSIYFQDSKVRLQVEAKYFWDDTSLWERSNNTRSNGDHFYNFVTSRPEVTNKYNTIHVFLPGDQSDPNKVTGRASNIGTDYGSNLGPWILLCNTYHYENTNQSGSQAGNLMHEMGHIMNLWHLWNEGQNNSPNNVQLPDTPPIPDNFTASHNYLMGYSPIQGAITVDQFTRIHRELADHPEYIISGHQPPEPNILYSSTANSGSYYTGTLLFSGSSGTMNVLNDSDDGQFYWTLTGNSSGANVNIYNSGTYLSFSGLGWLNFDVSWTDKCETYTESFMARNVYGGGGMRARQDPGQAEAVIIVADKAGTIQRNAKNDFSERAPAIKSVILVDVLGRHLSYNNLDDRFQKDGELSLSWRGLSKGIIFGNIITDQNTKIPFKTMKH